MKNSVQYSYEPGRNALTVVENEETVGTASTVSKYTYRYNELGQRTDRVDEGSAFAQPALYIWSYDDLGQVTAADRYLGTDPDNPGSPVAAEDATFDYDKIGNRLTSTFGTATQRDYTANALNQYTYLTNPAASPTHDADGNMTHDGGNWWFEWNGENRMVEARDYSDPLNPPANATRLSFTYDYQGRRVEKKVENYDGGSWSTTSHERFVYDDWNLIASFDVQPSSLSLHTSYLWGQDLSGSMQGAGGVGGLLSVTAAASGDVFYPTYDANGNVSEYLDENGAIAAHYEYSSFGRVISSTGSPDEFAFRFSTKYQDNETNLLYYGFRYYDPETGRWASRDPIEEEGGLNLYIFAGNDGVNDWDYLGQQYQESDCARKCREQCDGPRFGPGRENPRCQSNCMKGCSKGNKPSLPDFEIGAGFAFTGTYCFKFHLAHAICFSAALETFKAGTCCQDGEKKKYIQGSFKIRGFYRAGISKGGGSLRRRYPVTENLKDCPAEELEISGGFFLRATAWYVYGQCEWTYGSGWGCSAGLTAPRSKDLAFDAGGFVSIRYAQIE